MIITKTLSLLSSLKWSRLLANDRWVYNADISTTA
ncbi:hypothetical protein BRADI_1g23381v3 [Brachypodium distachyon]|uniref:Uncharacterized protein n=1 Tax=Brachypodium distachyon TaxID=15368 RepID=A0A2K2DKR0_BRADI|nr:hypothetical protein BRADI_1g23381v3 [Brachypodium distachyon]